MSSHPSNPVEPEPTAVTTSPAVPSSTTDPLSVLLRHVRESSEFPAFSANIRELLLIMENPNYSVYDLSRIILRDFSVTTQILKMVNSVAYRSYLHQVHTISNAVMLLGSNSIRDLVVGLKLFENFRKSRHLVHLKKLVLLSLFTAMCAHELAQEQGRFPVEEVFLTALLANIGEIITAYYFADEYHHEILNLVAEKNLTKSEAAKEVLQISMEELGLAIIEEWNLPETVLYRLANFNEISEDDHSPEASLRRLIKCAHHLSRRLQDSDLSLEEWRKQGQKFFTSLGFTSEAVADNLKASMKRFQEVADILSLDLKKLGLPVAATAQKREAVRKEQEAAGPAGRRSEKDQPPAEGEAPGQEKISFLYQVLEEISQSIASGAPINQIIMMVLEGIYRGLKLDRVAFCLVDPKRTWVSARFGLGEKVEELLPLLKAPMHSRNNAMVLSLENQKEILANPNSRSLDRDYMGEAFWNASQTQTFLVIPIIVDKKPIGVIYVDRLKPRVPISESDCQRIRTFRDQVIIAIRLSRRGLGG